MEEDDSSSSSTDELHLLITNEQANAVPVKQEPEEILESESAVEEMPSSDSSFETTHKRKQHRQVPSKRKMKVIRKPASSLVPKKRQQPNLQLRIVSKKCYKEADFQCRTCQEVF
jgi:hypothetical protein